MKKFVTYSIITFLLLSIVCVFSSLTVYADTKVPEESSSQESSMEESSSEESSQIPSTSPSESTSEPTPTKVSLKSAKIQLTKTTFTYTGSKIIPTIKSVKLNNKTLKKDKDYTITITNNVNKGTAQLTIKPAKGSLYTGSASVRFTIKARNIKSAAFKAISKKTYSGKAITPNIKITYNKKKLVKGKDYTLSYKKNNAVGTAYITIKGKGNYTGTVKKSFTIIPGKVKKLTASQNTKSSVALKWSSLPGIKNYKIYMYSPSKKQWKLKQTVSSNTYTIKGLSSGTTYKFKVRGFKTTETKTLHGAYSPTCTIATCPDTVKLNSVTPVSETAVTLKWTPLKNCSGYEIQYSTYSDFQTKSLISTKTVSKSASTQKITGLRAGRIYHFRIRAFKTINQQKYFGSFSTKKSNKVTTVYASYTTSYDTSNINRTANLRLACQALNGVVLAPGQQLNFDKTLGPRTAARGYKEAHVFSGGTIVNELGGGICQVASTIYNTALLANFQINERYQHSKTVNYVPLGRDAAIYAGYKNLRFTNTSSSTIRIKATINSGKLTIQFLVDTYAKPAKVTLKVTKSNGRYILQRYVNGKSNYSTSSVY